MTWLDRSLITGPRLCLCTTEKQWNSVMRSMGMAQPWNIVDGDGASTTSFERASGGVACVVCIDGAFAKTMDGIALAGMLVHEAVHVFQKYCDYVGEDAPSAEFEAYSVESIATNLMLAYAATALKTAETT